MSVVSANIQQTDRFTRSEENSDFDLVITQDEKLTFFLYAWIEALQKQLERIEELYLYDEIEKGEVFEELSERKVGMSLNEAEDLIRILTQYSYFRHQTVKIQKICKGHLDRYFQEGIKKDDLKAAHKELQQKWESNSSIKEFKATEAEIPKLFRIPFLQPKLFEIYVDYKHVDNIPSCSNFYSIKTSEVEDCSFQQTLDLFEKKLKDFNLNKESQWIVLVQKVFGRRLQLI